MRAVDMQLLSLHDQDTLCTCNYDSNSYYSAQVVISIESDILSYAANYTENGNTSY